MAIQILQENRRPSSFDKFSQLAGQGAELATQNLLSGMQKKQYQKENQKIQQLTGLDLSDIRDPATRQQLLIDQLVYGRRSKQAQGSQDVDYTGKGRQSGQEFLQENPIQQKNELPQFSSNGRSSKNQSGLSNFPQAETQGIKEPLSRVDQLINEGKRIAQQQTAAGNPTSVKEGYQIAKEIEQDKKNYNKEVEADTKQKVEAQTNYGNRAVDKLLKVFPNATDQQQAIFRKKGEEAAQRPGTSASEAEIDREMAIEATKFKNTIANIKKSIEPPRFVSNVKNSILGRDREAEKSREDIRIKLQPLLKEGLYDTSRNLLSELGYHAEERESIITDLGENAKKQLSALPSFQKENFDLKNDKFLPSGSSGEFSPETRQKIKNSLRDIMTADPSTNLILLRKAYEDKKVDWRTFKDDLNELILNGEIKLNDDQFNHLDLLDEPPLNNLEKVLHGIKLIGR